MGVVFAAAVRRLGAVALAAASLGQGAAAAAPASGTRFLLVRHGQAFSNIAHEGMTYEQMDRLTPTGHEQARRAGAALAREGVALLLHSPAHRAQETATDVGAALPGVHAREDERLRPLLLGVGADGHHLSWDEREAEWTRGRDPSPPQGESLQQVADRALAALRDAAREQPRGTVVVVAHDEVISALMAVATGRRPVAGFESGVDNGSITLFLLQPDGRLRLLSKNRKP